MSLWPPRREDQAKLDVRSGRKSKREVRPPDEKRRLLERKAGFEKACAKSSGRAGGRCRSGDLGAALLAEPLPVSLVALRVGGVLEGVHVPSSSAQRR